jgi:hypothetical protein
MMPSLKCVDHEHARRPIDRDNARNFFTGGMPIKVHLPIAVLVYKRPLHDRASLHTQLHLPASDVALLRSALPVGNNDDIFRIGSDQPHDLERKRRG